MEEDIVTLMKAVPQIEHHFIEQAGHLPHYEQAEIVNPLLIEFFRKAAGSD